MEQQQIAITNKTKVHKIKSAAQLQQVTSMMAAEAHWVQAQHRPMYVKALIGDFHGCGSWRILYPTMTVSTMREDLKMVYDFNFDPRDQSLYRGWDLIVFQRPVAQNFRPGFEAYKQTCQMHNLPVITAFEIDDWIFKIPKYNMAYDTYANKLGEKHLAEMINLFDAMTVSTRYLKKLYSQYFPEEFIYVIPNLIPRFMWDFGIESKTDFKLVGEKPVIFFAGGANRFAVKPEDLDIVDDITQMESLVRKTCDEWHWVFMGAQPLKLIDLFEKKKIEHLPWYPNFSYPGALRKVKADIALSPLIDNAFNRAKTNIKILEYGAVGMPGIYTNLTPYDEIPDFMKVTPGDTAGWEAKIREYLADENLRKRAQAEQLRVLNEYWLEDSIDVYRNTYKQIVKDVLLKKGITR